MQPKHMFVAMDSYVIHIYIYIRDVYKPMSVYKVCLTDRQFTNVTSCNLRVFIWIHAIYDVLVMHNKNIIIINALYSYIQLYIYIYIQYIYSIS